MLDLLEAKLQRLESYWPSIVADFELADLLQRSGFLRDAIQAARACDGFISIS